VGSGKGYCGIDAVEQDYVLCDIKEWVQWSGIPNMSIFFLGTHGAMKERGVAAVAINVTRCR
jgi:hypothetical protein